MRRGLLALILALAWPAAAGAVEIPVLAYHDIAAGTSGDPFAIPYREFLRHMKYLKDQRYQPISLERLDAVRRGHALLPPKPVLLTFDDGLKSYRELALPVLERYGYPSVLSVVTGWLDGENVPPEYRGRLLSWDEVREVSRSPLVEIVSHTHDLHHHIRSNPQGNIAPAVITRTYDPATKRYETEAQFRERVRADLSRSHQRLREELKREPLGIAWPYGQYDQVLIEEAARLGMSYHLTLDPDPTTVEGLPRINRTTFLRYRNISALADALSFREFKRRPLRFVEIHPDTFTGLTSTEREYRLSALLSRLQLLRVNAVLISPFTRDGKRSLFHNTVMSAEADFLNRLLRQLQSRLEIHRLYLRLPSQPLADDWRALYTDLARLNRFGGIVVDGRTASPEFSSLKALFVYYHPNVKVGLTPDAPAADAADFVVDALDAGTDVAAVRDRAAELLDRFPRALFLLHRPAGLTDERLNAAMRALRAAGARHYGYDNDDFLHDSPSVLHVVAELHGHTMRRGD